MKQALAPSSKKAYKATWIGFIKFAALYRPHSSLFPIFVNTISLYIAYLLSICHLAPSSIISKISHLSFILKVLHVPDVTKDFTVTLLLAGLKRRITVVDRRKPLDILLINKMVEVLDHSAFGMRERYQFKSMFLLAFFAFLRIGELTFSSKLTIKNILTIDSVEFLFDYSIRNYVIKLKFITFKHSKGSQPFFIIIKPKHRNCPVFCLYNYLLLRGPKQGPLFCDGAGNPIPRVYFMKVFNWTLKVLGLGDNHNFNGHSFRIGAATHAVKCGLSDSQIRILGRWKTNAFKKYIRLCDEGLAF